MEKLVLPNGFTVDLDAIASAGNIPASMARTFLSQIPADLPLRTIPFIEQLDRATTYKQVEWLMHRLCAQPESADMTLFDQVVKKMLDLSLRDLDQAFFPEEIREIRTRNIPEVDLAPLEIKAMQKLAEFFIIKN